MKLSAYTIQGTLFTGEIKSITLPTPLGEITVLENHLPLVSLVNSGSIRYTLASDEMREFSFPGGVLEVRPGNEVILLSKEG